MPSVLDRCEAVQNAESGEYEARVLDSEGKPCAPEELAEELQRTPGFERLVAGAAPADRGEHARLVAETLGSQRIRHQ